MPSVPSQESHDRLSARVDELEQAHGRTAAQLSKLETLHEDIRIMLGSPPGLEEPAPPLLAPVDSNAEEAARALVDSMTPEERADLGAKLAEEEHEEEEEPGGVHLALGLEPAPFAVDDGTIASLPKLQPPAGPSQEIIARVKALYYAAEEEAAHAVRGGCTQPYEPTPDEARRAREAVGPLLGLVFKLADREAQEGNGPGWLVWARVWCGLLLLRDAADGFAVEPGSRGAGGLKPEAGTQEEAARQPGADLMMAILGCDGIDGRPDLPEMAARLYG